MRAVIVLIMCGTSAVHADTAYWFWTVSDTGDRNGVIGPGESALLTLSVQFDPPQPQLGGMFGFAGPYDILGNSPWAAGAVNEYTNYLDWVSDDGVLDEDNNILQVENFQWPLSFDTDYDKSNPIELYFIRWTPGGYEPATVTLDNGGPDGWIYTDQFGATLLYTGEGGGVSFNVVPAPASAAPAMGVLAWPRRRRR